MNHRPRRQMTAEELEAVACLGRVRYPVASWDKRFAAHMAGRTTITDKEAPQVWRLFLRYRRQIHGVTVKVEGVELSMRGAPYQRLLDMAESLSAPDFRRQQAAAAAQDRVNDEKAKYAAAMETQ